LRRNVHTTWQCYFPNFHFRNPESRHPEIKSIIPFIKALHLQSFIDSCSLTFAVVLQTDRQTDKQWHKHDLTAVSCVCSPGGGAVPVESDGRPRGSFNRWNYNEVYRSPTPTPGGDAQVSWDTSAANNESYHRRWRQSLRYRTYSTTPPPTPGHRVEQDAKHDVDWAYDSSSFYLRVSVTCHAPTHTHTHARQSSTWFGLAQNQPQCSLARLSVTYNVGITAV